MSEHVGRIAWDAIDMSTGTRSEGLLLVSVSDVDIKRNDVTKGQTIMMERAAEFARDPQNAEENLTRLRKEIESDPTSGEVVKTWYRKAIRLSELYGLTHSEHGGGGRGFGLSGEVGGVESAPGACRTTFSWEWFTPIGNGKATKLQESGELTFDEAMTPNGPEISRMRFDTDVSLRVLQMGKPDRDPDWRINIKAGSEIVWPSLVDGQVVSNGFVSA